MALDKATEQQYSKRSKVQSYLGRWEDFKERRVRIIDKFVFHRKRQNGALLWTQLTRCICGLKQFRKTFDEKV